MDAIELSQHRVAGRETFYIPNFVTPEEEQYLLRKITESPQQKWKQLTNRRLQLWGGDISSKNVLFTQAMPSFLVDYPDIITRLRNTGAFTASPHGAPNHVILNEVYLPGQGIMPHEDGPSYYPAVATISLGSHSIFHYYRYTPDVDHPSDATGMAPNEGGRTIDPTPVLTVFLEPRSLVISMGDMYTSHLHGYAVIKGLRARMPLTVRSSIRETSEDRISRSDVNSPPTLADLDVHIANWEMLSELEVKKAMKEGGVLRRGTRYSLTCRDVERVSSAKPFVRR